MDIDLSKLDYKFIHKPLLVGGRAKEFWGVRKSGPDIDFVIHNDDYKNLSKKYPNNLKDLYGDLGVVILGFEIWRTICSYDYHSLSENAETLDTYKIISLEKLLFLTALGIKKEKYERDLNLIVERIFALRYKK